MSDQRSDEQIAATEALEGALARVERAYCDDPTRPDTLITGWLLTMKSRSFTEENDQFHYTHLRRHGQGIDETLGLATMNEAYWDAEMQHLMFCGDDHD